MDFNGLVIAVTGHVVWPSSSNHTAIRIIPNDACEASNPLYRLIDEQGRHFATLSAGPSLIVTGKLVEGIDRPSDTDPQDFEIDLSVPENENDAINSLFDNFDAYQDELDYGLYPSPSNNFYNSNSFTHGLLNASGLPAPNMDDQVFPGWAKPVPQIFF